MKLEEIEKLCAEGPIPSELALKLVHAVKVAQKVSKAVHVVMEKFNFDFVVEVGGQQIRVDVTTEIDEAIAELEAEG